MFDFGFNPETVDNAKSYPSPSGFFPGFMPIFDEDMPLLSHPEFFQVPSPEFVASMDPNFFQAFEQAFKNLPEDYSQWILPPFDMPITPTSELDKNFTQFIKKRPDLIKKIGPLTTEEREMKIQKYLNKKKRRSYEKKISYLCRKKVADNRIRVKGRFVKKEEDQIKRE